MASTTAFALVKWIGAAYLCFLGIKLLLSRSPTSDAVGAGREVFSSDLPSPRQVFWQGALTNVLNPKVALFFLAFLPQFVASDSPHKALAFLLLGLIFVCNGTAWCLAVAAFAARAAGRLRRSSRILPWINRALGGLFVYLGVRIAAL